VPIPRAVAHPFSNIPKLLRKRLEAYFLLSGIAAHALLLAALFAIPILSGGHSVTEVIRKAPGKLEGKYPTLASAVSLLRDLLPVNQNPGRQYLPSFPGPRQWPAQGVFPGGLQAQHYDEHGAPIQSAPGTGPPSGVIRVVRVNDTKSLLDAVARAKAGDAITLQPGTYRVKGRRIKLGGHGTPNTPVYVRAQEFGDVRIELDTLEGFFVDKSFWVFENLRIQGVCSDDSRCEHAFHVFGSANGVTLRNNELVDFNAALKVNGDRRKGRERFPDFGLVQNNDIYNTRPRKTGNPATPLNINAGNGWVVSANFIADFSKGRGNRISYAGFMKGNSENGVFERNLVVCHWRLPVDGDIRLGLSLGGGGTGDRFCRRGDCSTEHTGGIIRNNIIARCPADVGIYLNRAAHTQVHNNLLIANTGIDVRFATSSASIHNNIIGGRIQDRDGGTHFSDNNLIASECGWLSQWLDSCSPEDWYQAALAGDFRLREGKRILNRGNIEPQATLDLCGNPRPPKPDIGPVEYDIPSPCLAAAAGPGRIE